MKKQLRNIVISLCVVVLLVVGVLVWNKSIAPKISSSSSSSVATSSASSIQVYKKTSTSITKLHVKNSKGEFTINQKGGKFSLDGIGTSVLSQDSLSSTVYAVSDIEATKLIEKNAADLGNYGLKTPKAVIEITSGGKTETIYVGKDTPLADGTYICKKGSRTVYKADSSMGTTFTGTKIDYVDTTLYTVDSSSLSKLTQLEFGGSSHAAPIVLQQDTSAAALTASSGSTPTYLMVSPRTYAVNSTSTSTVVSALESISADGVISSDVSDKNLQKYGLKNPKYTFSSTYNKKKTTFEFGAPYTQDSTSYLPLIVKGKPVIYYIDASTLPFYNYQLADVTATQLFLPNITDLKTVSVKSGSGSYTIKLGGKSYNITGTVNGKKVKNTNITSFYEYAVSVATEGTAAKPTKSSTYATVVFTYSNAKKAPLVVKYFTMDSRRCYISVNGQCDFYTMRSSVDNVLTAVKNLAAGKTVTYNG